jgi:hypothetical protein
MKRVKQEAAVGKEGARARLAEALRDNLRKRKAQARARGAQGDEASQKSSPDRRKA